jgi:hypothetical protein
MMETAALVGVSIRGCQQHGEAERNSLHQDWLDQASVERLG